MAYETTMQRVPTNDSLSQRSANLPQMLLELQNQEPGFSRHVNMMTVKRGGLIAGVEELQQQMYILMVGEAHLVCTNSEGRRLVIATLEPGSVFGEGALINQGDAHVFAEAASDVTLWRIPAADARSLTIQYPILGWGLLQTYGRRLQQVENSLEDVAYKKLPERLAALLLELVDPEQKLIRGVSHQALADRLGTYRETVSAILRDFKRQGLVELGYRRITVLDSETLREIAGIWEW